jgi:uncharacterized repeat protein (TIGR01451 family)
MKNTLFAWILALNCVADSALASGSNPALVGWLNTSKNWGGTIQPSNSKYTERDTVPLRFTASLTPGIHTLLLKYDFTDSGGQKHFFDSLGSYNTTITNVNLIAGTSFSGPSNYVAIPTDPSLLPSRPGAQVPGGLVLYPVGLTAVPGSYSNINGIRVLPVRLVVPGTVAPGTAATPVPVLVAYGGHLATESDWGLGNGASKWPGASGKTFASIDGCSDLNVSVNPTAIIPSADLALTVISSPHVLGSGSNVTYTITVTNSGPNQATSVKVTNALPTGVTFLSATPTQTAAAGNNVSFSLGSINPLGTTTITLLGRLSASQCSSITDKAFVTSAVADPNVLNNSNSVTSAVIDATPPVITCPASFFVNADIGKCSAAVNYPAPTATDNCGGTVTVSSSPPSGSVFPLGLTVVTSTAQDAKGNTSTCSFTVTVIDATPPVITCPASFFVNADIGKCSAAVNYPAPTATDNCGGTVTVSSSPASGSVFPLGSTIVTSTAKDAAGNTSTCSFTVTVNDTEPPVITSPAPMVVTTDAGTCGAVVSFTPTATDNCPAGLTVTSSPASGSVFPVGTTTVTCTAKDAAGNTSNCSFDVTVKDGEPPQITCPGEISIAAEAGLCGAAVSFAVPGLAVTDYCDPSPAVDYNPPSGSFFPIGKSPVTVTATDKAGNTSTCTFMVAVSDDSNTSWPAAKELQLTMNNTTGLQEGSFNQCLVALDQSRWYKFKVSPESKVIVTLSGLVENYDLVLYKDILKTFEHLQQETDVNHLSAEFAGNAFSGSAFSPDALSGSAFSGSAFSGSAFSGSAFSSSVFVGSAFSGSAFSGSAFSPDAFAGCAFSPDDYSGSAFSGSAWSGSAFSGSAFSGSAFSAAQVQSVLVASAFEGIDTEGVIANTWSSTGDFYVRVRGRNGVFSPGNPFQLNIYQFPSACEGVITSPALPASTFKAPEGGYKTLILIDSSRGAMVVTPEVRNKLQDFANRQEVNGYVLDINDDTWVRFFNQQADANLDCPFAKNLVAEAIKGIIDRSRLGNALEYIVIIGGDQVIPFFRFPDEALIGPEKNYVPPVKDGTASQASLRLNYVPSQDFYGAKCELSLKTIDLPLPDLAVGRLVETATEVTRMLDAYMKTTGGVVEVDSSLVTGYDFLTDSSEAVAAEFAAGITGVNDTLISPSNLAPENCWTADDLRALLFSGPHHDLIYLAGHFSSGAALAADYSTSLLASELEQTSQDFENSLLFSAGCHSGYNVVDADGILGVTFEPDWVQAAARKGLTLIAGTGYQYGDTDFIEYSERIYLELARQLRTGLPGTAVPVGKALINSKLIYLAGTPDMRGIHTKAFLESTLYGLPMLSFNLPGKNNQSPPTSVVGSTTGYAGNPGATLGLEYADLTVDPNLTQKTVIANKIDAGGTVTTTYFEGGNGVINNPAEPILPLEVRSVGVNGTGLRGVGFRGGLYADLSNLVPLTGAATTEIRGVHASFLAERFYPVRFWNVNYFGALCGLGDGATRLIAIPAQFKSSSTEATVGTFRRFDELQFRLFYSSDLENHGQVDEPVSIPGRSGPPAISAVAGVTSDDKTKVVFSAKVVGDPAAGIQEVWVTYTATEGDFYGKWQSINLSNSTTDTTLWEGTLDLTGYDVNPKNMRYMVQAVNGVGGVTLDTKLGAYHVPDEFDSGNTAALSPTTVELATSNPSVGQYATTVSFKAKFSSTDAGIANRRITFSLGDQEVWAFTDATGEAAANFQLRTETGNFVVKASFTGDEGLAPSFATAPFEITRQSISLTTEQSIVYVKPGNDTKIKALLKDGEGNYILERSVVFVVVNAANEPVLSRSAITDLGGNARFGVLPDFMTDGQYTVKAYFNGQIPLPGGTSINLDDTRYEVATGEYFIITLVVDSIAPSLSCHDITVSTDQDSCSAVVTLDASTFGISDPNLASIVFDPPSGSFSKGVTPVTCVVTDKAGNTANCKFNVTVLDTQKPTISCPADVTVNTGAGSCVAVVNGIDPIFSDNCPGSTIGYDLVLGTPGSPASSPAGSGVGSASGVSFKKGVTTVTYTATDASGNSLSCSFTVTVNDTTPPVVASCPADLTVGTGQNRSTCDQVVSWVEPTATDNCGGVLPVFSRTKAPGSTFPLGTTSVTYVFKDASGNQASCSFNVTVIDTTPPVIACPANITTKTSVQGGKVNFVVTATDKCGGSPTVTSVPPSGSTFPIGTTTVTSTATDTAGNTSTCSFTVTVIDDSAPVITAVCANPDSLSPPNHKMVLVTVTVNATANAVGKLTSSIIGVTSSEPQNGLGDGDESPDWQIIGPTSPMQVYLRSERSRYGPGRTYTITVRCTDSSGNSCTATTTVFVPGTGG